MNAPPTFRRIMDIIRNSSSWSSLLDDIIIFLKNNDQHLKDIFVVLSTLSVAWVAGDSTICCADHYTYHLCLSVDTRQRRTVSLVLGAVSTFSGKISPWKFFSLPLHWSLWPLTLRGNLWPLHGTKSISWLYRIVSQNSFVMFCAGLSHPSAWQKC